MTLTGAQLLSGLNRFLGDEFEPAGLTTSAAGDSGGSTLVDDTLGEFEDDNLVGKWIRITSGTNQYEVRRIVKSESVSGQVEVRPSFSNQVASGVSYEVHRYNPRTKFTALDEARIRVFDVLAQTVYDDTTTADGTSRVFPIPTTTRRGPTFVQEESTVSVVEPWNFLLSPLGDSTTGYTATGTTASTVTRSDSDLLIPRLGNTATKLVTAASQAATYTMPIAQAQNGLTAALAASRRLTYARWVYCTEVSKVRATITDDSTTTYSDFHGGRGWELLTVERVVAGNNSTTLSAGLSIASTDDATTIYCEYGWLYFGSAERVRDGGYLGSIAKRVRRDDTTQQMYLDWIPARGRQLRVIGRDTLSALGTVAASQMTNAMEVDEENAQILYAAAAEVLFTRLGLNLTDFSTISANIASAALLRQKVTSSWKQDVPRQPIRGMWAS